MDGRSSRKRSRLTRGLKGESQDKRARADEADVGQAQGTAAAKMTKTSIKQTLEQLFDFQLFKSCADYKTQFEAAATFFTGLEQLDDGVNFVVSKHSNIKVLTVPANSIAVFLADVCISSTSHFKCPVTAAFAKKHFALSASTAIKVIRSFFKDKPQEQVLLIPITARVTKAAVNNDTVHCVTLVLWREAVDSKLKYCARQFDPNTPGGVSCVMPVQVILKHLGTKDEYVPLINGTNTNADCFPLNYQFLVKCLTFQKKPKTLKTCNVWDMKAKIYRTTN